MVEWMDNVEMAIGKLCVSKVYTSSEFKREKDNFQLLCKNLERAETKRWWQIKKSLRIHQNHYCY